MNLDILTAISPIDGRYRGKTESLAEYFSEYALIRYRVRVEIEYFITLCELPLPQLADFDKSLFPQLRGIYENFSEQDAQRVKDIEKVTNHDVKTVEYFIKEKLDEMEKNGLGEGYSRRAASSSTSDLLHRISTIQAYLFLSRKLLLRSSSHRLRSLSSSSLTMQRSGRMFRCSQRHMVSQHLQHVSARRLWCSSIVFRSSLRH